MPTGALLLGLADGADGRILRRADGALGAVVLGARGAVLKERGARSARTDDNGVEGVVGVVTDGGVDGAERGR